MQAKKRSRQVLELNDFRFFQERVDRIVRDLLKKSKEFTVSNVDDKLKMFESFLLKINELVEGQSGLAEFRLPENKEHVPKSIDEGVFFSKEQYLKNIVEGDKRVAWGITQDTSMASSPYIGRFELYESSLTGPIGVCGLNETYFQLCQDGLDDYLSKINNVPIFDGDETVDKKRFFNHYKKFNNMPEEVSEEEFWKTIRGIDFPILGIYEGKTVVLGYLDICNMDWWDGKEMIPEPIMEQLQDIVNLLSIPIINGAIAYKEKKARIALQESQSERLKLELQLRDKNIAGGFAHEIRNGLFPAIAGLKKVNGLTGRQVASEIMDSTKTFGEELELARDCASGDARRFLDDLCKKYEELGSTIYFGAQELDSAVKSSIESVQDTLGIVNTITTYAKISKPENLKPINLKAALETIFERYLPVFEQAGVTAGLKAEDVESAIHKDHFAIIVNNLVKNAVEAMETTKEKKLKINLYSKDGTAILEVQDTGIGIPEERKAKIFDSFYSTKPTTGIGLGLTFVEKIATVYNGKVEVDSEVGKGSRLLVRLP